MVIKKASAKLNDLDQVLELLEGEQLDIIFIEGFHGLIAKRKDVLKIITAEDAENLKRTLDETVQPILAVAGLIGLQKPDIELETPVINLLTEGRQLLELVKQHLKAKGG